MNSSNREGAGTARSGIQGRLGLRYKLLLLLVIPLVTAMFFAGIHFTTLLDRYRSISGALEVSETMFTVDAVLGGLQREMNLRLALIKGPDVALGDRLNQVQTENRRLLVNFYSAAAEHTVATSTTAIGEEIAKWRGSIAEIEVLRGEAEESGSLNEQRAKIEDRFGNWIEAAISILSTGGLYQDPLVIAARRHIQLLVQAQAAGAAEQRHVLQALASGSFSSSDAALVARARGINEDAIQAFVSLAAGQPDLIEALYREQALADQKTLDAAREDLSYHLKKQAVLNKLKVLTGFGGLIDDFRKFLIRGEAFSQENFEQKFGTVELLISEMEQLPGYPEADAKLLANLRETFSEYGGYFDLVATLQETGTPVEIIDQSVLIDDASALRSLVELDDFHPRTSAPAWWEASSDSLKALEVAREQIYSRVNAHLKSVQSGARLALWGYGLLLVAVVGIACALTFNVLRRTLLGINQVVSSMQGLSLKGDLDVELPEPGEDEVGKLSVAMHELVDTLRRITSQAEVIAEGDFRNEVLVRSDRDRLALAFNRVVANTRGVLAKAASIAAGEDVEIEPRGENDQLGLALVGMSESLAAYEARTRDEQWVNQGQIELSDASAADVDESGIADRLVTQIARYVKADAGIIWNWTGEQVEFLAAYGVHQPGAEFAGHDSGLIHRAIRDLAVRLISPVPENFFRIGSGFGSAPPSSVLIAPLNTGEQVVGALELAFFQAPDARVQKFVQTIRPTAASALQRAQARSRLQELLETSRRQSEKLSESEAALKAQSDQLLASNEELGEKTRLLEDQASQLRASEEMLLKQTEELQVINEELSERGAELEARNRQIERAKEEVEQKAREVERASKYKSEFLANMSHELRTPLNSMLILSGILADNEDGNLSDDDIESAKIIHDSGSNLLSLINDILDLSKVEAGKVELHLEPMSLPEFLAVMRGRYLPLAKDKGIGLSVELLSGVPDAIVTDPMRFEQIVTNLLSNALKFTLKGAVSLRISAENGKILRVEVSDTGIGIPADKLGRVFNAFEQADGSTTREFGGTGLGLAICMQLARLLGGRMEASSQEGKGSAFALIVPLEAASVEAPDEVTQTPGSSVEAMVGDGLSDVFVAPEVPASIETLPPPPVPDDRENLAPGEQSIVVIEDDINFLKLVVSTVRGKGIRALAALDGRTGIELIRRYRPCGVLLDVGLPDIDGWSVMERMKADPEIGNTPVHIISGQSEDARAEAMGAVGFATKPLTREGIHSAMRRVLGDAAHHGKRILVIDDHPSDRDAVVRQLVAEELNIEPVDSADDALSLLEADSNFSCVILDLQLQSKDGWWFLEEAARKSLYLPPIIIHTALELTDEQVQALRGQVVAIVSKNEPSRQRLLDEVTLFLHHVRRDAEPDSGETVTEQRAEVNLEALKGKVALVVDDDMRNVFALSKVLRSKGMQALKAPDGQKALHQLDDNADRIDIVLMDVMMPIMDGLQAIRELRKDPRFVDLPVIALTAKAMTGDREECIEAGADDYQTKPVDVPELLNRMANIFADKAD